MASLGLRWTKFAVAAILVPALLIAGHTPAHASTTYVAAHQFQIMIPDGWTTSTPGSIDSDDPVLRADSPDGEQDLVVLAYSSIPDFATPVAELQDTFQQHSTDSDYPQFQVITPPASLSVPGADSAAFGVYAWTDHDGVRQQRWDVFAWRGSNEYRLSVEPTNGFATQNQALLQQIVNSFQLLP
jgi:hypothetical protein